MLTIETLCRTCSGCLIRLGVDNSAAAWCLRRMFSSTKHGLELIFRAYKALTSANNTLEIVQLTSADNPADVPTRKGIKDSVDFTTRCSLFWRVMEGHRPSQPKPNRSKGIIRHAERTVVEEDESDEEENEEDPDDTLWDEIEEQLLECGKSTTPENR